MTDEQIRQVIHDNAALAAMKQRYPDIEKEGNAPTSVANPVTAAPQVPRQITLKAIMSLVPPAEMVKCYQLPGFIDDVRRAIDSDDREYMGILIAIAAAATAISSGANSTVTKLQALLAASEADPTWTDTIAGPSIFAAAGLPYTDAATIQGVDNRLALGGNW